MGNGEATAVDYLPVDAEYRASASIVIVIGHSSWRQVSWESVGIAWVINKLKED